MGGIRPRRVPRLQRMRFALRGLWPDRNPLRRASDRAEAVVLGVLLVAFLAGAPLTALLAGRWTASVGAQAVTASRAERYQVPAVLLADAPYQAYVWPDAYVRARWAAPGGTRHTGMVSVPLGTPRGTAVMIWIDRAGQMLGPPLRPGQVGTQVLLAAAVAPLILGFMLMSAGMVAHQLLERRRLAAWDADWRATGPAWRGPR